MDAGHDVLLIDNMNGGLWKACLQPVPNKDIVLGGKERKRERGDRVITSCPAARALRDIHSQLVFQIGFSNTAIAITYLPFPFTLEPFHTTRVELFLLLNDH